MYGQMAQNILRNTSVSLGGVPALAGIEMVVRVVAKDTLVGAAGIVEGPGPGCCCYLT